MRTALLSLASALLASACAAGGPADAPEPVREQALASAPAAPLAAPVADLTVWPADAELRAWVRLVAPRIYAATGLRVEASDEASSVPLFWAASGVSEGGWLGHAHLTHTAGGDLEPEWLALDPTSAPELRGAIVLHELLHALGAEHVGVGEGVLSPELWTGRAWPLTSADLESVCAAADCAWMRAEVGQ